MPSGLQIYDQNGYLTLDVTDNTAKYLGEISLAETVSGQTQTGSITDLGLTSGNPWWLTTLPPTNAYSQKIEVSINTVTGLISWSILSGTPALILYYGVY